MKILDRVGKISKVMEEIAAPMRLAILLSIGEGEACVCHLEAILKKRQAYISQHLMALRQAGIIIARRDGHYVYYRLSNAAWLNVIRQAGELGGVDVSPATIPERCECPRCGFQKKSKLITVNG